ncbi:MAG: DUF433 domain-containing protein [Chloroflexota bacterium]
MELVNLIDSDPERMSGEVCFQGTRVPVRNLFDYLAAGQPLSEFLDDFPGVPEARAAAVIHAADELLEALACGRAQATPPHPTAAGRGG